MIEIFGTHRMRMQLQTSEVREPGERRDIAWHDLLRDVARREPERDHIDPWRPALGRALLIEVLAFDAVGIAHEHVRSSASAAQRSVRYGDVVASEVELGVLRLREQQLVRVRDRDFPTGESKSFGFGGAGHVVRSSSPGNRVENFAEKRSTLHAMGLDAAEE